MDDGSTLTDEEFMKRLLAIADEGKDHSGRALHTLTEAKVILSEVEAKLSAIIADKIESDKSIRTIGQMIRNRIGAPGADPRSTGGSGVVKLVSVLVLAGAVCALTGAALPAKENAVVEVPNRFVTGLQRMKEKNWHQAAVEFSCVEGTLNRGEALAKEAECLFYAGELDKAFNAANDLERFQTSHPMAPYVRGLVYEQKGDRVAARREYELAEFLGCRHAAGRLNTVGR